MKKLLLTLALVLVVFAGQSFAQVKVGVIDLEGVVAKSQAGQKAANEFKVEAEKAQAKLKKMENEIVNLEKEIESQKSVLSPESLQKKSLDYQKKRIDLDRFVKDTQDDLQRMQVQIFGTIVPDIREVINKYSKDNKFDVILEAKGGVVYFAPALEITDAIVAKYDELWKNKKK